MVLTTTQEKFCQSVVIGANHSDTYRKAYNCIRMQTIVNKCIRMQTIAVNRNAMALMGNNEITARFQICGNMSEA